MFDGRLFNVSAVLGGVLQILFDDRLVVDKELLAVAQLAFYHCVGEQQQAAAPQLMREQHPQKSVVARRIFLNSGVVLVAKGAINYVHNERICNIKDN